MSEDPSYVRRSSEVSLSKVSNLGVMPLDSNKEVTGLYARTNELLSGKALRQDKLYYYRNYKR